MNFRYIREFSIVAKYKNLSDAAAELYTTQPVLSKHLAALEKELGVELFDRKATPMRLTYAGEVFLEESCGLLTKYHRTVARTKAAKAGGLAIESIVLGGLLNGTIQSLCMRAESLYRDRYFRIIHSTHGSNSCNSVKNLLKNRSIDISIEVYSEAMDESGILSLPLYVDKAVIMVEKSHPLSNRKSVRFEELEKENHITLNSNEDYSLREFCRSMCEKYNFVGGLPHDFTFKTAVNYQELLLRGLDGGIIILPESNSDSFPVFTLKEYSVIPIENDDMVFDIRAFYSDQCTEVVKHYLECLSIVSDPDYR